MKRSPLLTILSLTILLIPSCSELGMTGNEIPSEGSVRIFRSYDLVQGAFYDCSAELLAAGEYCLVYGEIQGDLSPSQAREIAGEFDNRIYGTIRGSFGPESDVDGNGKIILLYLDIRDGFSGSGGYVAGYFHSIHEFSPRTYADSNGADMLFMDTYPAEPTSAESYATIAHELQHLINFSSTFFKDGTVQDTWINEGLSSGAEYLYSEKVDQSRVDYYNADPGRTILYGNNFFVWKGFWETDPRFAGYGTLADYATVNLFFQWLRIHASNGTGIYRDILDSPCRDVRAVTEAAAA
ncbi:MAG: hypothetical protein JXA95_02925, partial [Spirochaetales bacterium]|nr:hypothetical protein [Spirochaetales bacterium]